MPSRFTGDRSLAQRAMQHPLLAPVYERAWRPFFGWAFMGFDLDHLPARAGADRRGAAADARRRGPRRGLRPGQLHRRLRRRGGADRRRRRSASTSPRRCSPAPGPPTRMPRATYLRGDATRLPFPDGSLDAVNCYAALYLIPDPYAAFDEMLRVLRPGGRIAVDDQPRVAVRVVPARPGPRRSARRGCGCSAPTSSPAGCGPPGSRRSARRSTGWRSTSRPPRRPDPASAFRALWSSGAPYDDHSARNAEEGRGQRASTSSPTSPRVLASQPVRRPAARDGDQQHRGGGEQDAGGGGERESHAVDEREPRSGRQAQPGVAEVGGDPEGGRERLTGALDDPVRRTAPALPR